LKYVAFLRAVNVGGQNVKMDDLRSLFQAMDFENVETFIASGNVIFDSPAAGTRGLEREIEDCLQKNLGYRFDTFIRTTRDLARIAAYEPFEGMKLSKDEDTLYIGFLSARVKDRAAEALIAQRTRIDEFDIRGKEIYWLYHRQQGKSGFTGAMIEKTIGARTTLRNANTVQRLAAKYPPARKSG
jgi:uncharacterized protein (DUF1697 family)